MGKKKKNKQYLIIDQVAFKESGWTRDDMDFVLEQLIDALETVKAQTSGTLSLATEEETEGER